MKTITDYFSSPKKSENCPKIEETVWVDENVNNEENARENRKSLENNKELKNAGKKKKRLKLIVPELPNMTELLENNLSLVSSSKSETFSSLSAISEPTESNEDLEENLEKLSNISVLNSYSNSTDFLVEISSAEENATSRKNAFQILMNSHNNIIGRNLEGKSLNSPNNINEETTEEKNKIKTRRDLLENWSELKGASKRKREAEDAEKWVNSQLKKREKRLKTLLKVNGANYLDEQSEKSLLSTKKKRIRKISSSGSENSNNLINTDNDNKTRSSISEVIENIEENAQDLVISKDLPQNCKESKLNFQGTIDKIKINEAKELIKIKMFTQQKSEEFIKKRFRKKKKKLQKSSSLEYSIENSKSKDSVELENAPEENDENVESAPENSEEAKSEDFNLTEKRNLRKKSVVNYNEMLAWDFMLNNNKVKNKTPKILKKVKNKSEEQIQLISSDEEEIKETVKKNSKSSKKLDKALLLKATSKPKVDDEPDEAKRKFLQSSIPNSLKKNMEKCKKSEEEKKYAVFPSISHIQQKCSSIMWNLPKSNLSLKSVDNFTINCEKNCKGLIKDSVITQKNCNPQIGRVKNLKKHIQRLKSEYPNYPVNKVFRQIYKKRSRYTETENSELWTEKYKPKISDEILGNYCAVQELKKWLFTWKNYEREINARKRTKNEHCSESDFESTDCDSSDNNLLIGNTMTLFGASGCGKTNAVYAIAKDLNFKVLELNASTKRTGKRILQDLQEATQSHLVKKNENNSCSKLESNLKHNKEQRKKSEKMCIVLIEDIDLIFEQDEGFLCSIFQLINISKRPIILTTTDDNPQHVQRFMNQYQCLTFLPLSQHCLGVWLQILCLVEGILVRNNVLGNLLEYNNGDIRKTLLEVQFWCQSGGQLDRDKKWHLQVNPQRLSAGSNPKDEEDVDICENAENCEEFVHENCLDAFEDFNDTGKYLLPRTVNLDIIWWNIPNFLNVPSYSEKRLHQKFIPVIPKVELNEQKLNSVLLFYESLELSDAIHRTCGFEQSRSEEPNRKNRPQRLLNSMELTENLEDTKKVLIRDLGNDLVYTMIEKSLNNYQEYQQESCVLNMTLNTEEKKWRTDIENCEDFFTELVPLASLLDRKSVAVDYFATFRDIARSEEKRAKYPKRTNRFRHYLKNISYNFKSASCTFASTIFNEEL